MIQQPLSGHSQGRPLLQFSEVVCLLSGATLRSHSHCLCYNNSTYWHSLFIHWIGNRQWSVHGLIGLEDTDRCMLSASGPARHCACVNCYTCAVVQWQLVSSQSSWGLEFSTCYQNLCVIQQSYNVKSSHLGSKEILFVIRIFMLSVATAITSLLYGPIAVAKQ